MAKMMDRYARYATLRAVGARCMLVLGVLATIAANVAYGASYGWLAALISAWPAIAFVGAAELVIGLIRRTGHQVGEASPGMVPAAVPGTAEDAARLAFAASIAGGNPLSMNKLTTNFGLTRTQARQILAAAANGHQQLSAALAPASRHAAQKRGPDVHDAARPVPVARLPRIRLASLARCRPPALLGGEHRHPDRAAVQPRASLGCTSRFQVPPLSAVVISRTPAANR